jgi:hypothetical protein
LREESRCATISGHEGRLGGATIVSEEGIGTQQAESRFSWNRELSQWLANPLLVTVVAAFLGSWLLPQITGKWQDHKEALEIKTGLVSQMSESVSGAVATSRFLASGLVARASANPHAEQVAWNEGYRDWTTASATIGAKLQAYFAPTAVGSEWRSFANVVTDFFQLSANVGPSRRLQVRAIQLYPDLPEDVRLSPQDWNVLATTKEGAAFQTAYAELGRGILERRDELVQRVLDSSVSGF